jgi:hypothetical protein
VGRGIYEGSPRTERIQLETRSSDPSNPTNGEAWLRTDLTGTDKVGEYRWFDGASVNAVDVVTPGSTSAPVEDVLRVQTPSGKGVIKTAPRSDAKYPEQSLQHAGSPLGLGYSAIPDSVVDNFEDGDLSEYSGSTGDFNVQQTTVFEGSYALERPGIPGTTAITSTSGLNHYPSRGGKFQYRFRATANAGRDAYVGFARQSEVEIADGYEIRTGLDDDNLEIALRDGGFTVLNETPLVWPRDEWLRVRVDWGRESTDDITVTVFGASNSELASVTATDSTFDAGGVEFFSSSGGGAVFWDEVLTT